jgi:hypothetical protein
MHISIYLYIIYTCKYNIYAYVYIHIWKTSSWLGELRDAVGDAADADVVVVAAAAAAACCEIFPNIPE